MTALIPSFSKSLKALSGSRETRRLKQQRTERIVHPMEFGSALNVTSAEPDNDLAVKFKALGDGSSKALDFRQPPGDHARSLSSPTGLASVAAVMPVLIHAACVFPRTLRRASASPPETSLQLDFSFKETFFASSARVLAASIPAPFTFGGDELNCSTTIGSRLSGLGLR